MSSYAPRLVGPLCALTLLGTAQADEPQFHAQLCVEYRTVNEMGRPMFVSHRLNLAPDELGSLAFRVEAVGENSVRVTVSRQIEGRLGFDAVEVVSKVVGEAETRVSVAGRGDKPLEVTADRVIVCYDRPHRWRVLTSVRRREDGQIIATLTPSDGKREVQARRFSARFSERQEKVSVDVSGVVQ